MLKQYRVTTLYKVLLPHRTKPDVIERYYYVNAHNEREARKAIDGQVIAVELVS